MLVNWLAKGLIPALDPDKELEKKSALEAQKAININ